MHRTDRQLEEIVGTLLRVGVLLAAVVVLTGGVYFLIAHGSETIGADFSVFDGEPRDLSGFFGIANEMLKDHSRGIIQFGILLLIATPVARVAISVLAFLAMRDRMYAVISFYVLAVLLYSLIWTS